jgi:hypothetical protein
MRIAIEHARAADRARMEAARERASSEISQWMGREFEASLVAVAASAHALDALYGSTVIPASIRAEWKEKGTKRHGKIREALKRVFSTGPVNTEWVKQFGWLFDLRDAAAHAEESPKAPADHPLGTRTAPEYVEYSTESATRAVTFVLSVLRWCIDHPKADISASVDWTKAHRTTVENLEEQWDRNG